MAAVAPNAQTCYGAPACEALVRVLVEQPNRAWIAVPQTPAQLLTGVHMLAYRALRTKLSCGDLDIAMAKLAGVPAALSKPPRGSRAEDVASTIGLAAEVQGELRAETELRCVAVATPPSQPERAPVAGAPQAAPTPDQLPTSSIEAPPATPAQRRPEQ